MNNVRDFGAKGDGTTLDTEAIQKAIDAGGMVYFPPGIYLSGTLYLKSDGGLDLSPGAHLLASPDRKDYNADDFCEQNRVFASEQVSGAHFIVAVEQHNITIRGGGRIDGNRRACDLAVLCIGTRPSLDYPEPGVLETGKGGIRVDTHMVTSVPGVYE